MEEFLEYQKIYSSKEEDLIAREFHRIKENYYLDHAGATLYSEIQIQNVFSELSKNIYANPHARNVTSKLTEDAIDIVRFLILDHLHTTEQEYSVIFTSGATAALKIVGECFDFGDESNQGVFAYLESNHTSVLGMRNFAKNKAEVKIEDAFKTLSSSKKSLEPDLHKTFGNSFGNSLFVYPAECNFSGTKFPLSWVPSIHNGQLNSIFQETSRNWYVLLDCACYLGTNSLDLSQCKPDFVPISFYKMFGYPTGLGALLVKKTSEKVLIKKYFGGGTVQMALSSKNVIVPRSSLQERFEDGTLPFLTILALKHGFETIRRLNINFDIISEHTFSLSQYLFRNLIVLHHDNGMPVVVLYHDTTFETRKYQGGILNFNLLRPTGDYIGYSEVLHIANLHGIHLRTGCFCNPGACQRFLKLTTADVLKHFDAGHVCGDQRDLVDQYPTGSVRISFGYMSTKEDADRFLNMVETCFVSPPVKKYLPSTWTELKKNSIEVLIEKDEIAIINYSNSRIIHKMTSTNNYYQDIKSQKDESTDRDIAKGTLQNIFLYPVKSCGEFSVSRWPLTSTGLKYDRQWMIINPSGVCLTQKQNKNLCLIKPFIDIQKKILKLKFQGYKDIEINLENQLKIETPSYLCQSKVCGDRIQGWDCGDNVSEWLSICLNTPGLRLLRQCDWKEEIPGRISKKDTTPQLSLANKAQYLLINSLSVDWLMKQIPNNELNENINSVILRFRPNFVISFQRSFEENRIKQFMINNMKFKSAGNCTRCQMICINQMTGEVSREPLVTLSREFKGKISFGIYLSHAVSNEETFLSVGCAVIGENLT